MSKTSFSTNNALTKKLWEEKLFRDVLKEVYFQKFMGNNASSLVQVKEDLTKSKGDKITFGIRMRLTGSGVTSGQKLEGNEESLTTYQDAVTVEQYRHAVRDDGALSRQRAMFSITDEAEQAIKDWASEKIDLLCFNEITSTPTDVAYIGGGTFSYTTSETTAKSALTASDKLEPNFLSFVKTLAKTGRQRSFVPLRPIKIDGKEYFILLAHPDVMYDIKTNSSFQQALREAQVRGDSNPLFKGASAIWDGVVVHEHENMPIGTDAGASSNIPYGQCVLLGAQSLCWAWAKRPKVIQQSFDYDNEMAYAVDFISGAKKPKFNSKDFGSIGVYVARTQVSDA